jgi:hypothetical protein
MAAVAAIDYLFVVRILKIRLVLIVFKNNIRINPQEPA